LGVEPNCCERNGTLWDLAALYEERAQWSKSSPVFANRRCPAAFGLSTTRNQKTAWKKS